MGARGGSNGNEGRHLADGIWQIPSLIVLSSEHLVGEDSRYNAQSMKRQFVNRIVISR